MAVSLYVFPCVCVRLEQLGSHWTNFYEIWYLSISRKYAGNIKFRLNLIRKTGTLHEDQYTFIFISHSILLRMANVSDEIVEKIKTHILCPITFFPENRAIFEIIWKYIVQPGRAVA
jgi:hypothetical protein